METKHIPKKIYSDISLLLNRKEAHIDKIEQLIKRYLFTQVDVQIIIDIFYKLKKHFILIQEEFGIKGDIDGQLVLIHIPWAIEINNTYNIHKDINKTYCCGINGAQGSGKSFNTKILETILKSIFLRKVASFSIDDFYKTREQRLKMGREIHPLFKIRSVPGTHDCELLLNVLERLKKSNPKTKINIPVFDKSLFNGEGDRLPSKRWQTVNGTIDIILFEGWIVGAYPQSDNELINPLNIREKQEDPNCVWRNEVNRYLKIDYKKIFSYIDDLFMLKVHDFEQVFNNRELQEKHLRDQSKGGQTKEQIDNFVMLFERLTKHMLKELPIRTKYVFNLKENHIIDSVVVNN